MRRPAPYAPLSVTFATGRTGTAIQNKYGVEGLGVWAAMIATAKRGRGQIMFAHDQDWPAIGVMRPPGFALRDFLKTTGQMKQTRTETSGLTIYVQLTRYGDWNDDAHRQRERERKTRKSDESNRNKAGRMAEHNRSPFASELEAEAEEESTTGSTTTVASYESNGLPEITNDLETILAYCKDADARSLDTLRAAARGLPPVSVAKVKESCKRYRGKIGVGYAVNAFKSEAAERNAA
jgi:hypothetical protein